MRAPGKHAQALAGCGRHEEAVKALCDGLESVPEAGEYLKLAYGYLEKSATSIPEETYARLLRVPYAKGP